MKLFGQYLLEKGIISRLDIVRARALQRKINKTFFEMVIEKGYIKKEDIANIQTLQEETDKAFDEIAVEEEIITSNARDDIIDEIERDYIHFGEALVKNGALSKEKLIDELKKFNLMTIKEKINEQG